MPLWSEIVELVQAAIIILAQVWGGNVGAGILSLSAIVRLALLPLTLPLARRALERGRALRRLQPELARLKQRYRQRPEQLAQATVELFERHRIPVFDRSGLLGALAQAPVALAMFSGIRNSLTAGGRFAWIADLARPDTALTVLVAGLTYLSMRLQPELPDQARTMVTLLPTVLTLVILSRMAAGIGLYWGASTTVGILQTAILRRGERAPEHASSPAAANPRARRRVQKPSGSPPQRS